MSQVCVQCREWCSFQSMDINKNNVDVNDYQMTEKTPNLNLK